MDAEAARAAATWAADLNDQDYIAAVTAGVRAELEAGTERTQRELLESVEPGELDTDPIGAASVLAFTDRHDRGCPAMAQTLITERRGAVRVSLHHLRFRARQR
ncbi:hypothetical protein [Streptomyces sp. rh34]|uniref:hypothetical protein n=1 Tax=Streptomyces sp. rh34 TaxID=2034272 RepID=UPI000BF14AD8|nr:hypothetical protein [Streptomyces sp. rh34]